jgi:caffeic acid 3-O-methyltransferase
MYALKLLGGFAGFAVPCTLKAVIELGIMDRLLTAEGAMGAEELTAGLPCSCPATAAAMVDRMLRFLASHSVVKCATEWELGADGKSCRLYAPAPVCKWFARGAGVESVVPFGLMMLSKTFMEAWYVYPCTELFV